MGNQQEVMDTVVVGAGPAGAVVAADAQSAGLRTALVDRGTVGQGIAQWPHLMRFFSTTDKVELPGLALITLSDKPTREEYLAYLRRFVRDRVKDFRPFHQVEGIRKAADPGMDCFEVVGRDRWGTPFSLPTRSIVLAVGAFDRPNRLGVPGEDLPHVRHCFDEVHPYALHRVVIVGGSSSAVETALLLWRAGASVTVIHRQAQFRPLKFWLGPDMDNRIRAGDIEVCFSSRVLQITPREVVVETGVGTRSLLADYVLVLTGSRPDLQLLQELGAEIDLEIQAPVVHRDTLETSIPGLFCAGVLLAGDIAGQIFIENSREHGQRILPRLLEICQQ